MYKTHTDSSVLQVLATELVISASLDPAGNIRRGSSAALQELIGRHPNTIAEGISVVQAVDYHAVALRSRAIMEVAFQASKLAKPYMVGILDALLGWRGVGDADVSLFGRMLVIWTDIPPGLFAENNSTGFWELGEEPDAGGYNITADCSSTGA